MRFLDGVPFHILTLEDDDDVWPHGRIIAVGPERSITWYYCDMVSMIYGRPTPPQFEAPRGHVLAHINHGRWIADCPLCPPRKRVSMRISKADPIFWCIGCRMKKNGGVPMEVVLPKDKTLREIETILLMRDELENRNWNLTERVSQLAEQNIANGAATRRFY